MLDELEEQAVKMRDRPVSVTDPLWLAAFPASNFTACALRPRTRATGLLADADRSGNARIFTNRVVTPSSFFPVRLDYRVA